MNGSSYSRRAKSALILSPDPLGAALIGAAVELAGYRASYQGEGESPPDAIRRTKPAAVLVDVLHPIVGDPASLGPALMTGAAIVFFGSADGVRDVKVLPASAQGTLLVLPEDLDRLPELIARRAERRPGRARSD